MYHVMSDVAQYNGNGSLIMNGICLLLEPHSLQLLNQLQNDDVDDHGDDDDNVDYKLRLALCMLHYQKWISKDFK